MTIEVEALAEQTAWVDSLRSRFPLLFARQCEVSVRAGWRGLVEALCEQLQAEADCGHGQPVARQIKQKFGELRVYLSIAPASAAASRFDALTDFAERLSTRICEHCGAPGRLIVGGYFWQTTCVAHELPGAMTAADFRAVLEEKATKYE